MNVSRILLVEDDNIIAGFIKHTFAGSHIEIIRYADAESAWRELTRHGTNFDAILLDRLLPEMDGMTLLRQIKNSPDLCKIPIIMETSINDINGIEEGLAAGVLYYLTKPLQPKLLLTVVEAAITSQHQLVEAQVAVQQAGKALLFIESGVFRYRTLTDAHELACGLARGFSDPERIVIGLKELLINAVEHGNIDISYKEKTQLVIDGQWDEEVERRLTLPEYRERTVTVTLTREKTNLVLTIQDQGAGFNWQKYMNLDPKRAFDPHGRGIAMSRMMSFDSLEYQGNGNTVIVKGKY
ncbi:MAG: response regulator [Magnetococcales bacterium]|nr:response regulator [Magnetococcales bacterium]